MKVLGEIEIPKYYEAPKTWKRWNQENGFWTFAEVPVITIQCDSFEEFDLYTRTHESDFVVKSYQSPPNFYLASLAIAGMCECGQFIKWHPVPDYLCKYCRIALDKSCSTVKGLPL